MSTKPPVYDLPVYEAKVMKPIVDAKLADLAKRRTEAEKASNANTPSGRGRRTRRNRRRGGKKSKYTRRR